MIATDPLSLVFIFCFLLGFGFFLIAGLLGGHGHAHAVGDAHVHMPGVHHGLADAGQHGVAQSGDASGQHGAQHAPQSAQTHLALYSYLNPTTIALFLLGFGFFGYVFHTTTHLALSLTLLLAIGGGLVVAILLLFLLSRIFAHSEGTTELDVVDRTGMLGKVSITIPEKGLGEIIYTTPSGMHKSIPARGMNNQRVERDQEVVVVNYQHGVAEVDTWESFMHGEMHTPDPATFDELAQLRALLNDTESGQIEMVMRQDGQKE